MYTNVFLWYTKGTQGYTKGTCYKNKGLFEKVGYSLVYYKGIYYLCIVNNKSMEKYTTKVNKDYALLDKHTGEILEYKQVKKVSIDEFIMVFFSSFPEVFKLEGNALKVLMCIWKFSSYNLYNAEANVFINNVLFKEFVRKEGLEIADSTIDVYISNLNKKNLLIKKCRGTYILNPEYFFKGTLSNRSKLKLSIEVG